LLPVFIAVERLPDAEGGALRAPVRSITEHGTPQQPEQKPNRALQLTAPNPQAYLHNDYISYFQQFLQQLFLSVVSP
jgi:hypothetical protein